MAFVSFSLPTHAHIFFPELFVSKLKTLCTFIRKYFCVYFLRMRTFLITVLWIAKWWNIPLIPVCMSFCNVTLMLLPSRGGVYFFTLKSGFSHVTCLGHRTLNINVSRSLKSAFSLGLALSWCWEPFCHRVNKPGLGCWRIRDMQLSFWLASSQVSLMSEAI